MNKFKDMAKSFKPGGSGVPTMAVADCLARNQKAKESGGSTGMEWVCESENVCRWETRIAADVELEDCTKLVGTPGQDNSEKYAFFKKATEQAKLLS